MYEDLVKDLRDPKVGDGTQYTKIYMRREAADAIENLQKIIDRQKDIINSFAYIPLDYRWWSVKEKLPDCMHNVLVTDGKDIGIGWIFGLGSNGNVSWAAPFADIDGRDVTHWMPLPALPDKE